VTLYLTYEWGILRLKRGRSIRGVPLNGVISNVGGFLFLLIYGLPGEWSSWSMIGQAYLRLFTSINLAITGALSVYILLSLGRSRGQ
jgi:hypothetical protein